MHNAQELPRAVGVEALFAARAPEVRALTAAAEASGAPWGASAAPRHLRRRATSHARRVGRRKRRRRFLGAPGEEEEAEAGDEAARGGDGGAQHAPERPERQQGELKELAAAAGEGGRRRRRRKRFALLGRGGEAASGSGGGSPALRLLETHVWHAKRMVRCDAATCARWGVAVFAGTTGAGRGHKATLAAAERGACAHDASYHAALRLRGQSARAVAAVLEAHVSPKDAGALRRLAARAGKAPSAEAKVMLHAAGAHPRRALAPTAVTFWGGCEGAGAGALLWVHPAAVAAVRAELEASLAGGGGCNLEDATSALRRLQVGGSQAAAVLEGALSCGKGVSLKALREGAALSLLVPDPRERRQGGGAVARRDASAAAAALWSQASAAALPASDATVSDAARDDRARAVLDGITALPPAGAAVGSRQRLLPRCACVVSRGGGAERAMYTVVVPRGWAKVLWRKLTFTRGVMPCGVREWRWLHAAARAHFFPDDYPDCDASSLAMAGCGGEMYVARDAVTAAAAMLPRSVPRDGSRRRARKAELARALGARCAWREGGARLVDVALASGALRWQPIVCDSVGSAPSSPPRAPTPVCAVRVLVWPCGRGRPLAGAMVSVPAAADVEAWLGTRRWHGARGKRRAMGAVTSAALSAPRREGVKAASGEAARLPAGGVPAVAFVEMSALLEALTVCQSNSSGGHAAWQVAAHIEGVARHQPFERNLGVPVLVACRPGAGGGGGEVHRPALALPDFCAAYR